MACCGSRRALATAANRAQHHPVNGPAARRFFFRYSGSEALTVSGPASGLRYRLAPGAVVEVDPRDVGPLAAVPHLDPL